MEEIAISKIYKRKKNDRDIFQELMPFKVKEILLVATYYDSYTIVREGQFSDKIVGEYLQLNLYTAPRFTSVTTNDEALEAMDERNFDVVILMAGLDKDSPLELSQEIKKKDPDIPVLVLVNNNSDLAYFDKAADKIRNNIERVFVWNGSTKIFMAMTKYIEDKMNLALDSKIGDVRVMLLIEDSVKYYSRYLPLLYTSIMTQTQKVISDEDDIDEMHKILKMRARPKVILVSSYEDAVDIVDNYLENLLCVISDVRFSRDGKLNDDAGVDLISYVQEKKMRIPCVMQSHDTDNAMRAFQVNADFINKNSDTLALDIFNFIHLKLGFGDFVFRNHSGTQVAVAKSLEDFENKLRYVPDESLLYHSKRNGISTWLMARGEINIAKKLRRYQISDFKTVKELRQFCLDVFEASRLKQLRGRIIKFKPSLANSNHYVIRLGGGSVGGKGRGLAFLSNFTENISFQKLIKDINIAIPRTAIIGVDEYEVFLENNNLLEKIYNEKNYDEIKKQFIEAHLSEKLCKKLRQYLEKMNMPLAVRSSGLFEDSLMQPFAGVYATYLLPNNNEDFEVRYADLINAIKMVYSSIFTPEAKAYFSAVDYKIEEEKMAVILQAVVGQEYNGKFYPNISGVAQSYNYYPFSYMKPEDGFSVLGLGLGKYVVGGEKTHRFCPEYPKLQLASIQDQIKNSQNYFYAIDVESNNLNLLEDGEDASTRKYELSVAEKDGNLLHCASVYDGANDRIEPDLNLRGPRVVDFANILKYNQIPLAKTLSILLNIFKQAMGAPIEIEFAVDLSKGKNGLPTFNLLQIKPLIRQEMSIEIDMDKVDKDRLVLLADKGMGNGRIDHVRDVIYMDVSKFDRTKTEEMAEEVAILNQKMKEQDRQYVLIGPGRWGTKDRFTGIPVLWSQISNAKVIVEQGLDDFPLDASLGSHFFHNVTSMNVGYFSVKSNLATSFVKEDVLNKQEFVEQINFFKHVRFAEPLEILMDGKKQISVILHK
ncbi:PEP/pyruvate-binding domain-containing protein [Ancylomarina sp. 16SWW S1-10-2]|uniref:PEP/pyruvate-binding domain-containing protein n=1 Tax=Ancylomarina sp. 16SWW S1-10-2 TaxID=2499681 RepID=UPI0012ADD3BB|nr:PEP/pyruvate-binding domain-containing protein [Ancylomarina sp. 16SWW S1-10-2]MRT91404.1 response regulator [Ancylomarina sp. 16SWW S1-10-2]